jgi:hypothetical protein
VIGGLLTATIATLVFVPVVFSLAHARHGRDSRSLAATPDSNPPEVSHA